MFRVNLAWSPQAEPEEMGVMLPESVNVAALPPEGTIIDLAYVNGDVTTHFSVEVEFVVLDAEDPLNAEYVLHVVPA